MFNKILELLKRITSYTTVLMFIGVGLFNLFYEIARYKRRGLIREVKVIRAISYSYLGLGAIMFLLLILM